ncbi:M20/M25/M40 family metallo-hydrolase [Archangium violaceum]|uniref:M20/M25/M40 family metallo-hydrolase n=1 Tax=Archangium violaceum TaxID=83451 RepID=UPI001950AB7C|nr:M20/M25/M40 family metallo-hydrolase [Archangium violaceum]QRN97299.1 M20/M25/M40 family metallo-hydrolase [Archangium violaceum]
MPSALPLSAALLSLLTAAPKAQAPVAAPKDPGPSPQVAAQLIGAALSEGRAYARLAELTDGIGPRLSGSEGEKAAVQWAKRSFEADGVKVWLEPVKVPRWVRGEESGRVLASERFREHPLALLALGGSVGTPAEGVTGEVLEVRSLEEVAGLGEKVKGKIVFFNHAMAEAADYGKYAGLRTRGASVAAKSGAVAVLVRSLATASLRSPHTGAMRYDEGVPQIPAAAVSVEDAELLHRLVAGGPVKVELKLGCQTQPDADSFNVVAEVKGREKPKEVVLLGAHLDSWDVGTGAHDDGAGVTMVMETARLLGKLKPAPRRTVRVVLFANEENGLRGGRAYAEAHAAELGTHVAALEMDSGGGRPLGVTFRAGPGGEELVRPWLQPLEALGAGVILAGEAGGADISPLIPARVPFVGVRVDSSRYFDVHHSHADTLDKVNPKDLAQSTAALAWVSYVLAEVPGVLPRPEAPPAAPPTTPKPAAP